MYIVICRNVHLNFKNLYPSKKPMTVIRQLKKSIDFRQNYVCDCHSGKPSPPLYGSVTFTHLEYISSMVKLLYIC
jgi:hypothetical protein